MSAAVKARIKPDADLWQIAETDDKDLLERALARGADVNACNGSGLTALMVAAYHGRREMVSALLEHGADLNAVNSEGLTAAMLADDAGHEEIVRTLVALGVKKGRTAHPPETSPIQFPRPEMSDEISDSAMAPEPRAPGVRTLKEPPDIWDLVHESRKEFNPGSALIGRLTARRPLLFAAILLVIGGVGVFWFRTSPGWSGPNTAATPVPAESSKDRSVFTQSNLPRLSSDRRTTIAPTRTAGNNNGTASSSSAVSKLTASSTDRQSLSLSARTGVAGSTIDDSKTVALASAVSLRRQGLTKARRQNRTTSTIADKAGLAAIDNKDGAQGSNSTTAGSARLSRTDNKDRSQGSTSPKADNEKSSQLSSPAKASATPKPKVIPWP